MMMYILHNENVIKKWHSKILKILYLKIVITIIISQYDKTEKDSYYSLRKKKILAIEII